MLGTEVKYRGVTYKVDSLATSDVKVVSTLVKLKKPRKVKGTEYGFFKVENIGRLHAEGCVWNLTTVN